MDPGYIVGLLSRVKKIFSRRTQSAQESVTEEGEGKRTSALEDPREGAYRDLFRLAEVLKENDRLRGEVLDLKTQVLDIKEGEREEVLQLRGENQALREELQRAQATAVTGDDINPTREAAYWILQIRPRLRTKTLSEILGVSDRTIRRYRSEFKKE